MLDDNWASGGGGGDGGGREIEGMWMRLELEFNLQVAVESFIIRKHCGIPEGTIESVSLKHETAHTITGISLKHENCTHYNRNQSET